ncbi:hypothetical protein RHGRI_033867 [Rhododendron griersonianum]|uniref:Insecticidal crystal toxin domain-containing protein n=1 Tax=Rhododendron griersonianum TaxID=479676 RepID=A0AAV6I410_9ERIC|nr:hypothetical protein RHGRI_033867 [Rhododendron griersonianum]
MYVTRPLSHYLRSPESLSLPPEGPNSGYLVMQDEESETTTCFGLCKKRYLIDLPFPQNKNLTVRYSSGGGDNRHVSLHDATFIPVLNQPLSLNRYYAIKPHGSHKGEAYACSREEDMTPLAPDGFPPIFLRSSGWTILSKPTTTYELGEALGIKAALRARLPNFNSPIVVGKWYCPFMFIKDGNLKDQMKQSLFYEMTLEQSWERIFACENNISSQGNSVTVEAEVQREVVFVGGREAVWDENRVSDGVVWFRGSGGVEEVNIGLSSLIVDRMKWEEERRGWVREENRQVKVKRTEEFGGIGGGWSKFGCYVLVERFVLKRMDGSVVLTYDFKHTHVIRSKWE